MGFEQLLHEIRRDYPSVIARLIAGDNTIFTALAQLTIPQKHKLLYVLTVSSYEAPVSQLSHLLGDDYFGKILNKSVTAYFKPDRSDKAVSIPPISLPSGTIFDGYHHNMAKPEPFFSVIDHIISRSNASSAEGDIDSIRTLIDAGVDPKNICATIDASNEPHIHSQKRLLPKTTLQFAMDCGLDDIVSLLINTEAHKDIHTLAFSTLEYAIILNRLDYVKKLYREDPDYAKHTIRSAARLNENDTVYAFYKDRKTLIDLLVQVDPDLFAQESDLKINAEDNHAKAALAPPPSLRFTRKVGNLRNEETGIARNTETPVDLGAETAPDSSLFRQISQMN